MLKRSWNRCRKDILLDIAWSLGWGLCFQVSLTSRRRNLDAKIGIKGTVAGDVHPGAVQARISAEAPDLSPTTRQAALGQESTSGSGMPTGHSGATHHETFV